MQYVMSDIHGEYDLYRAMLDKIGFGPCDTLYVLGDCIDRGPQPVKLLQDMAQRSNVYPLLGNHEAMALHLLPRLLTEITAENCKSHLNAAFLSQLMDWQTDGGDVTIKCMQALPRAEQHDLFDYLHEFSLYETVDAGERTFVLTHAGIARFTARRPLRAYAPQDFLLGPHDFAHTHFDDPTVFIVLGHTPTLSLGGEAKIYHHRDSICIDCGAAFQGGRLACLCLDTMQEFYVSK